MVKDEGGSTHLRSSKEILARSDSYIEESRTRVIRGGKAKYFTQECIPLSDVRWQTVWVDVTITLIPSTMYKILVIAAESASVSITLFTIFWDWESELLQILMGTSL